MIPALNNIKLKWIGDKVECYDPTIKKQDRTFYRSCMINNQQYDVGDYAVVENVNRKMHKRICKILCMYESCETRRTAHRFCCYVRWYTWAKNLKIGSYGQCSFSPMSNEVVEDLIKPEELISLEQLSQKCYVYFALPDDLEFSHSKFGDLYFPCRYKITESVLEPIISESMSSTLLEEIGQAQLTPHTKENSSELQMFEETIIILRDDLDSITPFKNCLKSEKNDRVISQNENLRDEKVLSTLHRKVNFKRNLNKSFDNSQSKLLNYSIIDQSDEEDETIKLKLRISNRQRCSNKKIMKNKDTESCKVDCNKSESDVTKLRKGTRLRSCITATQQTPSRKSKRLIKRISYADYISPIKKSPSKRNRSTSTNSESSTSTCSVTITKQVKNTPSKIARKTKQNSDGESDDNFNQIDCKLPSKSSPLKRNRFVSTSSESVSLNNIDKNFMTQCVVKLQNKIPKSGNPTKTSVNGFSNKSSPKKVRWGFTTDSNTIVSINIGKNITDLLQSKEISLKYSPQHSTDSIFSDLLKTTECKIEQLDIHLSPKKYKRNYCDDVAIQKTPKTPRARIKLLKEGLITPSIQARSTPIKANMTPLSKARAKLHVSYVPKALPCRETEFKDIFNFIEGKLLDNCGGCMYVSGVPGTGKTATVSEVIKKLQALIETKDIPNFKYINLNGMKLTEPRQSYVEILKQLTGKTLAWEQAQNILDVKFTKAQKKSESIVLVVDELDILCTKRQDVVYNLLDWPSRANVPLIIITIANTMDLPERLLMGRVTSRLGLTRLTFQAYTHNQLQRIVTKRLMGINAFNPDAIQLVARKVASVSGDARRALDICRKAAEIAELENSDAVVSMSHVNKALNAMITQPKVKAIRQCSRLQQLLLQAVVSEVERTGVEEATFSDVFTMLVSVASLDGFQMVSSTVALRAVSSLGACRLLLLDQKSSDINQKMMLNISLDDVYYALRRD